MTAPLLSAFPLLLPLLLLLLLLSPSSLFPAAASSSLYASLQSLRYLNDGRTSSTSRYGYASHAVLYGEPDNVTTTNQYHYTQPHHTTHTHNVHHAHPTPLTPLPLPCLSMPALTRR